MVKHSPLVAVLRKRWLSVWNTASSLDAVATAFSFPVILIRCHTQMAVRKNVYLDLNFAADSPDKRDNPSTMLQQT